MQAEKTIIIKTLLLQAGIRQKQLAKKLAVSEALVSHVVCGRRRSGEQAQRIARGITRTINRKLQTKHTVNNLFGGSANA